MSLPAIYFAGLGMIAGCMLLLWLLSLRLSNAAIVDNFWGCSFVLLAWMYFALSRLPAAPAAGGSAGHHLGCAPQHTHLAAQPRPPGRFSLPCLALAVGQQLCLAQPVAVIFAARRTAVADIGAAAAGPGTARTRSAGQVGCTWHPALAGGLCVRSRRELAAATLQSQAC